VLIEDCTGIDDKAQTAFSLYPNPSNGNFTISLNTQDVLSVRIITASGNLVYNEQNVEVNGAFTKMINTSGLAQGVYYLSVTGSQTNITEKIIIQK
jgi:trimeric autotransporter adhesin